MAAAQYYNNNTSVDDLESDIGILWQDALNKYAKESDGTDLRSLDSSRWNMNVILAEQDRQVTLFTEFRHNKGKLDKLRSLVARNSAMIQSVAGSVVNAASTAFPPGAALLTAFNYVMNASKAVSEDYDMIVTFFDIMHSFLDRVSMLENRVPKEAPFQKFLINVFTALLTLCAIARKCRKKGRLSKWAKALIDGTDPKLKGAYESLHTHLQRFESATMIATLKQTIDTNRTLGTIGKDIKDIQAGVDQVKDISQQNYHLGLETLTLNKETTAVSSQMLIITQQTQDASAEQADTLRKIERSLRLSQKQNNDGADQNVDAGARKSTALKKLQKKLGCEIDTKEQLEEIEATFVKGTCQWFKGTEAYADFENGKTQLLWITGPPGIGKSSLTYTIVKSLQEEHMGEPGHSVAHFFFREDLDNFRSMDRMLRSCACQISLQDVKYREDLLADLQRDSLESRDFRKIRDDKDKLWERLFGSKFGKGSERKAVLILDGIDEATEPEMLNILELFNKIASASLNIQILFTSAKEAIPIHEKLNCVKYVIGKENVLKDMRLIALTRMKQLPKLRKLRSEAKKKIVIKLRKKADSKCHCRLSDFNQEKICDGLVTWTLTSTLR